MATGFLDYLFDSDYRQRRDIDSTAAATDLALESVEQLPASRTSMTEDGPVCDRCMAGVTT
jgi:hypothetical protein